MSTNAVVTQIVGEVAASATPTLEVTQVAAEVAASATPTLLVTQVVAEVAIANPGFIFTDELDVDCFFRVTIYSESKGSLFNAGGLLGAWADATGALVTAPFPVGNSFAGVAAPGATQLLLGMNDGLGWANNLGSWTVSVAIGTAAGVTETIDGRCMPWSNAGGLNAAYTLSASDGLAPVSVPILAGDGVVITYVSGTASIGGPYALTDADGLPNTDGAAANLAGIYCDTSNHPDTLVLTLERIEQLHYRLADSNFFNERWMEVTPYDELGDGVPMTIRHQYTAAPPDNATVTTATVPVVPPTSPTDTTVPTIVGDNGFTTDYLVLRGYLYNNV